MQVSRAKRMSRQTLAISAMLTFYTRDNAAAGTRPESLTERYLYQLVLPNKPCRRTDRVSLPSRNALKILPGFNMEGREGFNYFFFEVWFGL